MMNHGNISTVLDEQKHMYVRTYVRYLHWNNLVPLFDLVGVVKVKLDLP